MKLQKSNFASISTAGEPEKKRVICPSLTVIIDEKNSNI